MGAFAAGAATIAGSLIVKDAVSANADHIDPPDYPFSHKGWIGGFDASAIRRGHQVYTNVCATCHSMNLMAYRNLVDVAYAEPTQDERKLMGMKWTACLMVGAVLTGYYKRFRWGPLKSRRISYIS